MYLHVRRIFYPLVTIDEQCLLSAYSATPTQLTCHTHIQAYSRLNARKGPVGNC